MLTEFLHKKQGSRGLGPIGMLYVVSSQKGGDKSAQAESVTRRASGGSRIRLELPRTEDTYVRRWGSRFFRRAGHTRTRLYHSDDKSQNTQRMGKPTNSCVLWRASSRGGTKARPSPSHLSHVGHCRERITWGTRSDDFSRSSAAKETQVATAFAHQAHMGGHVVTTSVV